MKAKDEPVGVDEKRNSPFVIRLLEPQRVVEPVVRRYFVEVWSEKRGKGVSLWGGREGEEGGWSSGCDGFGDLSCSCPRDASYP